MMSVIVGLPLLLLGLAVASFLRLEWRGKQHACAIGFILAPALLFLLEYASTLDDGQLFSPGPVMMKALALLLVICPLGSLICLFVPAAPVNGSRDIVVRLTSFLCCGAFSLLSFLGLVLSVRC